MQYPNNNRPVFQPQPLPTAPVLPPDDTNQKRLMLALAGFVVLIIIGVVVFLGRPKKIASDTGQHYDPGSGETVSNPVGKTPEYLGQDSGQPLYLGFSKLLDIGITQDQLKGIKLAFEKYPYANNKPAGEISIFVNNITSAPHDVNDTKQTIYFPVLLNRKDTYYATVDYFDLTTIHLYIKETSSATKIVYDSGNITPDDVANQDAGD